MKRVTAIVLVLIMAFSLSACHRHSWVEATCDEPRTCSECGKTEGEALGHDWSEPIYEWSEDLSRVTATRVCRNDPAHTESETVETSAEELRPASCTEPGETRLTATFDNGIFAPQSRVEALPAPLGHTWGEAEYEWSEDMSSVTATRVCENDPSHVETEIADVEVVATASDGQGPVETVYTAVFGNEDFETQTRSVAVEVTGPGWDDIYYEWSDDMSALTATRVRGEETETVSAEVKAEVTRPASCETAGETTYTAQFEDEALQTQSLTLADIAPLGHAWSETVYEWSEDLKRVTATRVCANDPAHTESETAEVKAEVTRPASCEEKGETSYTAVFENGDFEPQSRTEANIAPLGHDWSAATHTQPAICALCGAVKGEPLPIHYYDLSFDDYCKSFNRAYPGFLKIRRADDGEGYVLRVNSDAMTTTGLDHAIRFGRADEFDPETQSAGSDLQDFNLIEISFVSDSPKFDTSISGRVAQLGYYAAKTLDPELEMNTFFKEGLDLFHAKGNEQSFTHNGFVYTLSCAEQDGGYRYAFTMTLEENLE